MDANQQDPAGLDRSWPLSLRLSPLPAMLNFELADHPVYDAAELQWFDDDVRGTGMLAFLSRRGDRRVDYYQQPGLHLDRAGYHLGGGTGAWTTCQFDVARLEVAPDGVDAEARFHDIDGRPIHIRVDDRDGRPRRRAGLLAPVSAGIDRPTSLLLVWMPSFDLVRVTDNTPPLIRIGSDEPRPDRLPGRWLHRRHLIKYAAPLLSMEMNREHTGPAGLAGAGQRVVTAGLLTELVADDGDRHRARLVLEPGMPAMDAPPTTSTTDGRWHVEVDRVRLTGGAWSLTSTRTGAQILLDVDEPWRPRAIPGLMRLVTTVVPVFRRWPTTYRWGGDIRFDSPEPTMSSRWWRTGDDEKDS